MEVRRPGYGVGRGVCPGAERRCRSRAGGALVGVLLLVGVLTVLTGGVARADALAHHRAAGSPAIALSASATTLPGALHAPDAPGLTAAVAGGETAFTAADPMAVAVGIPPKPTADTAAPRGPPGHTR